MVNNSLSHTYQRNKTNILPYIVSNWLRERMLPVNQEEFDCFAIRDKEAGGSFVMKTEIGCSWDCCVMPVMNNPHLWATLDCSADTETLRIVSVGGGGDFLWGPGISIAKSCGLWDTVFSFSTTRLSFQCAKRSSLYDGSPSSQTRLWFLHASRQYSWNLPREVKFCIEDVSQTKPPLHLSTLAFL